MGRTGIDNNALISDVLSALRYGKENAIHQTELAAAVGVSASRVKKIIRGLRQGGFSIISDASGYYMAETREEIRRFIGSMSKQAASRFDIVSGIKQAAELNEIDGQMSIIAGKGREDGD